MEVLTFDIQGKFAHFRKFYGNNTATSYSMPPRTTIIGILAAVMGEQKDSYYQKYQSSNIRIGIRVLNDIKKSFHRLNYLKISGRDSFTGKDGRVQTPFEVVTGNDLKSDSVNYRIYLSPGTNNEVYESIKEKLLNEERQFNISLGIAGFSAFIRNVNVAQAQKSVLNDAWIDIHSACNSDQVSEIDFPENQETRFNHIEEELLPADFIGGDKGREVYRMNRVLFATSNFPLHVKLKGEYFTIAIGNTVENIQFLDYAGVFSQQES